MWSSPPVQSLGNFIGGHAIAVNGSEDEQRRALREYVAARTSTATADSDPWGSCTGASDCPERWHVHGCFADRGQCDDPTDHAATADTGLRERVEALTDAGFIPGPAILCNTPRDRDDQWRKTLRAVLDATAAPTTDTGVQD